MTSVKERAGAVLKIVGKAVGAGILSFVLTTLAMVAITLVLVGGSLAIARAAGTWAMVAAAVLTVVAGGVAWYVIASKRALTSALAVGVQQSELGRHSMELIFDRLLRVDAEDTHGERGRKPAEVAERIPLQKVEARLTAAVDRMLAERSEKRGVRAWMARKIRAASIRLVQRVTLEELRDDDAKHGGVDLVQARDKLAKTVDKKLVNILRKAARKATRLMVALLLLVSLGGAVGMRYLFLW